MRRTLLLATVVTALAVAHVGFGQSGDSSAEEPVFPTEVTQRGQATQIAPGITVIVDPQSSAPMELATEIFYAPHFIEVQIPYDRDFTTFGLELASRIRTRIFISVEGQDIVSRTEEVIVPNGGRVSTGFAVFGPHVGLIKLYNENMELLAEVPYMVTKQGRFQQTVAGFASAAASTDFSDVSASPVTFGASYRIAERASGVAATVSIEYSTDGTLGGRATISGAYSW
ncbi:MAG: hypothetical protein KF813_01890 [Trueperaceae bacterium]|nr:hypothetical protein [Trueperaceae bacterium]